MSTALDFHTYTVTLWDAMFGPNNANHIAGSFGGERICAYGIFNGEIWYIWRFPDNSTTIISQSGAGIKP